MKKNTRTTKELDKKEELQKANAEDIFKDMTWNCHICGEERPNDKIDVVSGQYKGFKDAQINVRYCNDRAECQIGAANAIMKGEFPVVGKIKPSGCCKAKFRLIMIVGLFFMLMIMALIGKYL